MRFFLCRSAALTLLFIVPVLSSAADLPGAVAFNRAADAVIAASGEPGKGTPLPISDPRVQTLLAVSDFDAVFGDAPLTVSDIPQISDICGKANRIQVTYGLANLASAMPSNPNNAPMKELQRRLIALENHNTITYQDVTIPMRAFAMRCLAREMPLLAAFFKALPQEQRTPVRLGGLAQMRLGIAQELIGAIVITEEHDELSPKNRHIALAAAAAAAPNLTAALQMPERSRIVAFATSAKATAATDDQAALEAIIKAVADEHCEGLCQINVPATH